MSFIGNQMFETKRIRGVFQVSYGATTWGYMAFLHICGLFDFMFHDAPGLTAAGWIFDLRCVHPEIVIRIGILRLSILKL